MIVTTYGVSMPKTYFSVKEYALNKQRNQFIDRIQKIADKHNNKLLTTEGERVVFIFESENDAKDFLNEININEARIKDYALVLKD